VTAKKDASSAPAMMWRRFPKPVSRSKSLTQANDTGDLFIFKLSFT
jgi:hypothetical protein